MEDNQNIQNEVQNEINDCSCNTGEKKKCCCKCNTIVMVVLFIAVAVLYVLHFTGVGTNSRVNPDDKPAVVAQNGGLKIAYVNTDTLNAKYEYIKVLEKELKAFSAAKENSYKQQMTSFQNDYQNFLKTGDQLTLSQQQAKEADLKQRAAKLSNLEQELAMQVAEKQAKDQEKMVKAVYAFIREYNAANQQFNLILAKSGASSPVLYGDEEMDITDEIVNGLNEEYRNVKKNEKAESDDSEKPAKAKK